MKVVCWPFCLLGLHIIHNVICSNSALIDSLRLNQSKQGSATWILTQKGSLDIKPYQPYLCKSLEMSLSCPLWFGKDCSACVHHYGRELLLHIKLELLDCHPAKVWTGSYDVAIQVLTTHFLSRSGSVVGEKIPLLTLTAAELTSSQASFASVASSSWMIDLQTSVSAQSHSKSGMRSSANSHRSNEIQIEWNWLGLVRNQRLSDPVSDREEVWEITYHKLIVYIFLVQIFSNQQNWITTHSSWTYQQKKNSIHHCRWRETIKIPIKAKLTETNQPHQHFLWIKVLKKMFGLCSAFKNDIQLPPSPLFPSFQRNCNWCWRVDWSCCRCLLQFVQQQAPC